MIKSGYLLAGARLDVLMRLVWRHGISLRPSYLLRFLFLLQSGIWSSIFSFRENRLMGKHLASAQAPDNPLFIVGHWRTGTTFLHQLLHCDPHLAAPTLFQCTYPDSLLTARRYVAPILGPATRGRRPMDDVEINIDSPQEDEFALLRLAGASPIERLIFPKTKRYFLLDDDTFLPPDPDLARWERAVKRFLTKLQLAAQKRRIVLKNPFHSMRIRTLRQLFPKASFIHICRNPLQVIPSTVHLWSVLGRQNALKNGFQTPTYEEVITVFDRMVSRIHHDLAGLPDTAHAWIRFEDLETDPLDVLRFTYDRLSLEFTDAFEANARAFLAENKNYKKNRYELTPDTAHLIRSRLGQHMNRFGYL